MRRREKKKKANPPKGRTLPRREAGRGQTTTHTPRWERLGARFSLEPASPLRARPLGTGQKERSPPGARAPDTQRRGHGARNEDVGAVGGRESGVKPVVRPVGKPQSPGRLAAVKTPRRPRASFKAEEETAAGTVCAPGCNARAGAQGPGGRLRRRKRGDKSSRQARLPARTRAEAATVPFPAVGSHRERACQHLSRGPNGFRHAHKRPSHGSGTDPRAPAGALQTGARLGHPAKGLLALSRSSTGHLVDPVT